MGRIERQSSGSRDRLSVRAAHGLAPLRGHRAASVVPWSERPMRLVRLGSTGDLAATRLVVLSRVRRTYLQKVRISELANDNFNSE